jgi:hypothetical protein
MKVYISKYRYHWLSPYTILEKVLFWKDWENIDYDTPWVEKWTDRLSPISMGIQKFLDFVHPKINYVKIDKWDTWNMDNTLSIMILPMLKQLKATKQGAPCVDDEDVPEELRSTSAPAKENEWDIDDNHFKRWDWVLDQIIWTFEQKQPEYDWMEQYYSGTHDTKWVQTEKLYDGKPTYQMVDGPNNTWKADWDAIKVHQAKINNGLKLFGKYYENLWD